MSLPPNNAAYQMAYPNAAGIPQQPARMPFNNVQPHNPAQAAGYQQGGAATFSAAQQYGSPYPRQMNRMMQAYPTVSSTQFARPPLPMYSHMQQQGQPRPVLGNFQPQQMPASIARVMSQSRRNTKVVIKDPNTGEDLTNVIFGRGAGATPAGRPSLTGASSTPLTVAPQTPQPAPAQTPRLSSQSYHAVEFKPGNISAPTSAVKPEPAKPARSTSPVTTGAPTQASLTFEDREHGALPEAAKAASRSPSPSRQKATESPGMSRRDRRALERALKKGQKHIRHGRIICIGPGRSGKSALIRSMLNKIFQHTNSTIGIEVGKVRCAARSTEGSLRFEEQKEQVFQQKVRMARDAILDIIKQEKKYLGPVASDIQLQAAASPSGAGDQRMSQEDQATAPEFAPLLESEFKEEIQCAEDVLKAFIDALRSHNALEEDILEAFWHFDLWDFAGQKPFEALQHMFLSSARCAYLIVFDATKLLEGRYHDEFCDSSGESHDGNVKGCSYFRAFESWLHIVQQVAGDDVEIPVYAVGTHIDVFDATVRQEELRKVEDRIWKVAEKRAYSLNLRKVFFVNNTKSGSEQEDPEIGVLCQELVTSMESQCSMPIPISWMPFAPVLDAITQQLHMRILRLDQVQQIARKACQDKAVDVDGLLAYHHHLGQIVQCRSNEDSSPPGSLPQALVIIDTDWLVQAAASLFTPEPLKSRAPRFRPEYKLLFDEGILLESLAIHRWSQSELTKDLVKDASQRQVVLTLLSQFDLLYSSQSEDALASAPDRKYIVPALVNRPADLQHSLSYHTRTPSYYIVCGKLQVFPQVLFWCSLVRLMKGFNIGTQVLLFKNRARLLFSSGYWLEMTLFDSGIRLTIEGEEDDVQKLAGVCRQVVDLLSRDLLALRSVSLRHVELFQAVRCECTSGDRPCHEHHAERCQNISCFHFARLPLCADPKYSSDPPVFRCPLDAKPRAVVDNQAEMQHYWLPDGSKVGITPEQSRGTAPRNMWEPSRLLPKENLAGSKQSLTMESLPEERHGNPWKHARFITTTYSLQDKLTQLAKVRGLCYSLQLIGTESYDQLQLLKSKFDHNEKLLSYLKTGDADSFAKFREVMRHLNKEVNTFAKILEKWDTIGPLKEDYQHIERQLNDDD